MYVWLVYINQWHCTIGTNETNIILVCIFALRKDVFKFIILISIVVFVLWDLSDIIEEVIYRHTDQLLLLCMLFINYVFWSVYNVFIGWRFPFPLLVAKLT